jgi:hypothetical protein
VRPLARGLTVLCAAVACSAWTLGSARAGGGAATDAYDGIDAARWLDVHGLVDVYLQHDLEEPGSNQVAFRPFDPESDTPAVNLVRLTLAHRPDWLGFRLDVGAGALADNYLSLDPAATAYPGLSRALSYGEQAFVTAALPGGLVIDAGKFGTPLGIEDNESPGNWNYSRSLLFTLAEPSYHTGVRATLPVAPRVAVSGFWLNGWDTNVLDGDGMRSFGVAASWTARPGLDLVADYVAGLEHAPTRLADPTLSLRQALDAYAIYSPRPWLTTAATVDWGADESRGGVGWWGVGGYLRAEILRWLATTARAEHLADPDGFLTATPQRLVEGTLTLEARTTVGPVAVIGRLEGRRDQSDVPVFQGAAPGLHQDTVTLGLMAAF